MFVEIKICEVFYSSINFHIPLYVYVDVVRKSPFQRRKNTVLLKKQVKFTNDMKCCSDVITTILPDTHTHNGNGKMFIIPGLFPHLISNFFFQSHPNQKSLGHLIECVWTTSDFAYDIFEKSEIFLWNPMTCLKFSLPNSTSYFILRIV